MKFRKLPVPRAQGPKAKGRAAGALAAVGVATLLLIAGCGGGGGGGGGGGFPIIPPGSGNPPPGGSDEIVASSTVAGRCNAPRNGVDPDTGAAYPDRAGSLTEEKRWVRGWINETYLWYGEVPATFKAADYATPVDYFNVLKTTATTLSGRAKDRFHFIYDTEVYRELSQAGISASYGAEFASLATRPPRELRIAFVEPNSPAANAGLQRGAKLLEIDGIDFVNATGTANANAINSALSPKAAGESHKFVFEMNGTKRPVDTLVSAKVTSTPVQNVKVVSTASGPVGYLQFNDHITTSEAQLISAMSQFQSAGVKDLVLDMRYNGGGQLNIASRLAYMVSSSTTTFGKTFERLSFNDKNPFGTQSPVPFLGTSRTGQPLPQLGLSQVTVLTGPDTCSASESVVNGLRGIDVKVNLVGGATCGKPYGFYPQDNCGTTYFAIQFQGVNNKGFGDYGDGMAPTCNVADDFGHQLGDPAEARFAAALTLRGGACPAGTSPKPSLGLEKGTSEQEQPYLLERSPLRDNRLLERQPSPQG